MIIISSDILIFRLRLIFYTLSYFEVPFHRSTRRVIFNFAQMMKSSTEKSENIFQAVVNDDLAAFKHFLEVRRIPGTSTTIGKQTAAHIAAKNGRLEILKYLLNKEPGLINSMDVYGNTPLFLATEEGALDIVQYLLEECEVSLFEPNKRLHGNIAVHIAAQAGQLEVLRYFIKTKKADPNVVNALGEPPCFFAAAHARLNIIKFLAEETNANLLLTDRKKDSILFISATKGDATIPKYLIDERKLKFDINKRDSLGRSIACIAARMQHLDFLKYIVGEKHADIHKGDFLGQTPLHQAAMGDNVQVVKYLLDQGADPNQKDYTGKTPSQSTKNQKMIRFLESVVKSNRNRRSISSNHRPSHIIASKKSSNNWITRAVISNQNFIFSERRINGRGAVSLDHVNSSQVNGFLLLLGTWVKCPKRSTFERAKYGFSMLPQDVIEDRMDPLAVSAILYAPRTT